METMTKLKELAAPMMAAAKKVIAKTVVWRR
jgi:hypothetical protein